MDEPTAAVDDETKGIVHHLLEKVVQGKTVIMITHDPYLLKFANRIITMKDGEVVEDSARPDQHKQQSQGQRYRPYT
jgi:ABC-type bacteriocin/lantibiotic exporter with double-glycine peptidase domain